MFGMGFGEFVLLLIPIIGAVLGVSWAGRLGRSRFGWGLLGLFIPISVVILLFLRPANEVDGRWKRCPKCQELVLWQASRCKHCQAEIG